MKVEGVTSLNLLHMPRVNRGAMNKSTHKHKPCRWVKDDGQPCKNYQWLKTEFCWLHILRAVNWTALAISVLLGFVCGIVTSELYFQRSKNFQLDQNYKARKVAMPKVFYPTYFTEGGITSKIAGPTVLHAINFTPLLLEFDYTGQIRCFGEIRDSLGRVAIGFHDDAMWQNTQLNYDINSDASALEVVNDDLFPVFQLYKDTSDGSIQVNYVHYEVTGPSKYKPVIVCSPSGTVSTDSKHMNMFTGSISRIFEYPGFKNSGVRKR